MAESVDRTQISVPEEAIRLFRQSGFSVPGMRQ